MLLALRMMKIYNYNLNNDDEIIGASLDFNNLQTAINSKNDGIL